jgi:uncharacterized membrane protein
MSTLFVLKLHCLYIISHKNYVIFGLFVTKTIIHLVAVDLLYIPREMATETRCQHLI